MRFTNSPYEKMMQREPLGGFAGAGAWGRGFCCIIFS